MRIIYNQKYPFVPAFPGADPATRPFFCRSAPGGRFGVRQFAADLDQESIQIESWEQAAAKAFRST
jgi:hypothetical protein